MITLLCFATFTFPLFNPPCGNLTTGRASFWSKTLVRRSATRGHTCGSLFQPAAWQEERPSHRFGAMKSMLRHWMYVNDGMYVLKFINVRENTWTYVNKKGICSVFSLFWRFDSWVFNNLVKAVLQEALHCNAPGLEGLELHGTDGASRYGKIWQNMTLYGAIRPLR